MTPLRTLVVHAGGIGDFLLTCPALAHLAEAGPLELLGRPERLALAVAGGIAEAAHDLDRSGFESLFSEPNELLRTFLSRFGRCVVWMRDDGVIERGIRACGLKDVRVFPGLPPQNWTQHASAYYLDCLGYAPESPFRLHLSAADAPQSTYDVVIHPGSGGRKKNWPHERFVAIAKHLLAAGRSVAWCTGPAEENAVSPAGCHALRTDSLVDLARVLASAHAYLGNDSGITHLAAATGCRTTALFSTTDPKVWAPRGEHVTVLQGDPWPAVDEVRRFIENRPLPEPRMHLAKHSRNH